MKVRELKRIFPQFEYLHSIESEFLRIETDSRKVQKGDMFVAIRGTKTDSHKFVPDAVRKGATVIVGEEYVPIQENISFIKVPNSRIAYALFSSAFFGFPSERIKLVGITGTSGKTTTAYLLYKFFNDFLRIPAGFIGTTGTDCGKGFVNEERFPPTTPDAFLFNKILYDSVQNGLKYVFAEISSSAILFRRIEGATFYGKILTNIGKDHLEVHKTFEDYLKTKIEFFETPAQVCILNADSEYIEKFSAKGCANILTYGIKNRADVKGNIKYVNTSFTEFSLKFNGLKRDIRLNIPGYFNVYNYLALSSFAFFEGVSFRKVAEFAERAPSVPGRMNVFVTERKVKVVIDFAHNPMEVESVLKYLNEIKGSSSLITVTGAVGWSVKEKRENIGKIASSLSDTLIITTDDPRGDDPERIIEDVSRFAPDALVIRDREKAIKKALKIANPGDIVVLLGRGDEREIHFKDYVFVKSDLEMVKENEGEN